MFNLGTSLLKRAGVRSSFGAPFTFVLGCRSRQLCPVHLEYHQSMDRIHRPGAKVIRIRRHCTAACSDEAMFRNDAREDPGVAR